MKLTLMVPLLVVAACARGPADLSSESSRFPRTDRKSWSEQGWEGLRWGMGPGDVEVYLGPKGMKLGGVYEPQRRATDPRLVSFVLKDSVRTFGGEKVSLGFEFLDDALYGVSEEPVFRDDFPRMTRWAWNGRVEFAKKWGEPTQEKGKEYLQASERGDGHTYFAEWESEKTMRAVGFNSSTSLKRDFGRAYSMDPVRGASARNLVSAVYERERAERERQSASEAATSPRASGGTVIGKVREVISAPPYAYARLATSRGDVWVAFPAAPVSVGQPLCFPAAMPIQGFESKTLRRRFDVVYFGTIGTGPQCK